MSNSSGPQDLGRPSTEDERELTVTDERYYHEGHEEHEGDGSRGRRAVLGVKCEGFFGAAGSKRMRESLSSPQCVESEDQGVRLISTKTKVIV